jgi:hypothetical protein
MRTPEGNYCPPAGCLYILNDTCVFYTGPKNIPSNINTGDDLKTVIGKLLVYIAEGGSPGSAIWGNITGTLSNQTDLQDALNLKVNLSDFAKADGITKGIATFNSSDFTDNNLGLIGLDYVNGQKASSTLPGFLSSSDWETFDSKAGNIGIAVLGASDTSITSPHSTLAVGGKFYVGSSTSSTPGILVYNDPNNLSDHTVIKTGVSGVFSMSYSPGNNRIYGYVTSPSNDLFDIDPTNNIYTSHGIAGLSNISGSGICSDPAGNYIFISNYSTGVLYKISTVTWSVVSSVTLTNGASLHSINYVSYSDGDEIIATSASTGYIFNINPSDLTYTSLNTLLPQLTDDLVIIKTVENSITFGSSIWIASEQNSSHSYRSASRGIFNGPYFVSQSLPTFGLFYDGTYIYNVSSIGYIERWLPDAKITGTGSRYYVGPSTQYAPNEIWFADNGDMFFTNFSITGGIVQFTLQEGTVPILMEEQYSNFLISYLIKTKAVKINTFVYTEAPLTGGGNLSNSLGYLDLSILDAKADGVTKGAATFKANDFNDATGLISLDYTNGQKASTSLPGFLSAADWNTFNTKIDPTRSLTTTSPLSIGGTTGGTSDLSANRTIAFDFSVANTWTGIQTLSAGAVIANTSGKLIVGTATDNGNTLQVVSTATTPVFIKTSNAAGFIRLTCSAAAGSAALLITNNTDGTADPVYVGRSINAGALITGSSAGDAIIRANTNIDFCANNGASVQMQLKNRGTLLVGGTIDDGVSTLQINGDGFTVVDGVSGKLHYYNNSNHPTLEILRTASSGYSQLTIGNSSQFNLRVNPSGEIQYLANTGGWFQTFYANGVEAMRLSIAANLLIGTTVDVASSILNVTSTTKGFLPPRMTTTQKNAISSPAEGLVVYDTVLKKLCVYTGSAWETVTSS